MTSEKAQAHALADLLDGHLVSRGVEVEGTRLTHNFATNIIRARAMGATVFNQSESRRQILSLCKPLESLQLALSELSDVDRSSIELHAYFRRMMQGGAVEQKTLADLDRLVGHYLKVLLFAQSAGVVRPRRLAHMGTDWRRVATVHACREIWAWDQMSAKTSKWRKHVEGAPKDPSGMQDIDPDQLGKFIDTFAPVAVQRDLPGRFGRFVEAVLEFFPERDANNNPFNAADSLRAYHRVRKRSERGK